MQEKEKRYLAEQIFSAGVASVVPDVLVRKWMKLKENILYFGDLVFDLTTVRNIYVVGAGKASALMGAEVEKILGARITEGHIVVKKGHSAKLKHIKITEAGHPVPDLNGLKATNEIIRIAVKAGENDLVICLISGGGSALLADFPEGSSLKDVMRINYLLVNSGACIQEINAVRKHISSIKGGQLARHVSPASLVTLILSDVPGDAPDVIASGPTVADTTTFRQAMDVLTRFDLLKSSPVTLLKYINDGIEGKVNETPKTGDNIFKRTYNLLIGTNRVALEASKMRANELNINAVIIDDKIQGDITTVAEYIVNTAVNFQSDPDEVKPVTLLFGGETTVKMTGTGQGGRNQHMALLCAGLLQNRNGITILAAGTDGNDGPTNAAGAIVDTLTYKNALARNIDPEKYLKAFDSYSFFKKTEGHVITGPTRTNVMDIIVVIVE